MAGSLESTSSPFPGPIISARIKSGSCEGDRARSGVIALPDADSEADCEPDADSGEAERTTRGEVARFRDVADFFVLFDVDTVEVRALELVFAAFDFGAALDGPALADARGRGGLNGSRLRF